MSVKKQIEQDFDFIMLRCKTSWSENEIIDLLERLKVKTLVVVDTLEYANEKVRIDGDTAVFDLAGLVK